MLTREYMISALVDDWMQDWDTKAQLRNLLINGWVGYDTMQDWELQKAYEDMMWVDDEGEEDYGDDGEE